MNIANVGRGRGDSVQQWWQPCLNAITIGDGVNRSRTTITTDNNAADLNPGLITCDNNTTYDNSTVMYTTGGACATYATNPNMERGCLRAVVVDYSSDYSNSTEGLLAPSPTPPSPHTAHASKPRSMTVKARLEMTATSAPAQPTPASQVPIPSASKHNDRYRPKPSERPKLVKIDKQVQHIGRRAWTIPDGKRKKKESSWPDTAGEVINHAENTTRKGHYRIKISKDVYLDAELTHHFEGRFVNHGKRPGKTVNMRFAAGYRLHKCSTTNLSWIRIYATRNIQAGEELYLDYGKDFWRDADTLTPAT